MVLSLSFVSGSEPIRALKTGKAHEPVMRSGLILGAMKPLATFEFRGPGRPAAVVLAAPPAAAGP